MKFRQNSDRGRLFKKILFAMWVIVITGSVGFYIVYHEEITPESISEFLKKAQNYMFLCYAVISMLRGFTLLPNTPLVLAGTILFSDSLFIVFAISMWGIVFSSAVIYYFSEYMGFDDFFDRKYPEKVMLIREKLDHPWGVLFVILWAFFPLVPTDAVCYVAGSVRMNIFKFIMAVFAGELVLVSFYIWIGKNITDFYS